MSAARQAWPDGLLLAYYGDDFTGSTDAMEALAAAGVPTVLFLEPPTPALLQRFPEARCVGLAGTSRGRAPEWMDARTAAGLRAAWPRSARRSCTTRSARPSTLRPRSASIGRAIEHRRRGRCAAAGAPMVVGAPRAEALPGLRQPVRRGRRRGPSARPPPDDVAPPGHADGRGGPAAAPGATDGAPHRADRPGADAPGRRQRAAGPACRRRRAGGAARRARRRDVARSRPAGLGAARRRRIQRRLRQACSTRWRPTGARSACCRANLRCRWRKPCRPSPRSAAAVRR